MMTEVRRCNICQDEGCASEIAEIRSNVRMFRDERFAVWRCRGCGSLHCGNEVDLEHYYRYYPFGEHELDFWARTSYRAYLNRLRTCGLTSEHRVLDYGCGPGLLLKFLQSAGINEAYGYDAHVPKYADPSVLDQRFDWIIAQDLIEHVDDPAQAMQRFASLLPPGGMLCIGTPNAEGIDLHDPERFIHSLHQPYHRHILSERALLALGGRCGFQTHRVINRFYYDTLVPTVNYRFLLGYLRRAGNDLDAAFEPPKPSLVMFSPALWILSVFGYFMPPRSEMMVIFRRL